MTGQRKEMLITFWVYFFVSVGNIVCSGMITTKGWVFACLGGLLLLLNIPVVLVSGAILYGLIKEGE